ncbi:flagellar hook capping FlgD N-terminal domain-containing protein [uncultured Sphingomonas sp.]|uniref:flagellar hook capping FlgD N-terminal domain-containing protein n=1 Tax=uncultured Sphingomonas sp. TaxID=158754 RepID=UPI0025DE2DC8|nr:flagellar hook capping FlgD N-terminal domain-containing protein [uncultured Sphingomonas sp.]
MSSISTGNSYLDSLNAGAKTAASAGKSNKTIDQAGFLKLLTTQLTTQDPTQPVDNSQMAAQMAQFSSVTGIAEMNQSLKTMASDLAASRFGDASGWIGRAALVDGSIAAPATNGAYAGQISLPADAKDVTLSLIDGAGQTVYAKSLGAKSAGDVSWAWDGKDANSGELANKGPLRVIVTAAGTDNKPVPPTLSTWTEIQSVQSPATGSTRLNTVLGQFAPSDVLQLS